MLTTCPTLKIGALFSNRIGISSSLQVLAKTQPVAVAVVHLEVATAVGLIADSAHDLDALGLEFRMERIRVIDPNVGVPGASLRVCGVVGTHEAGLFELRKHDDDAVALDHAKTRRLTPKALVPKAELISIIVGGGHHVIDDEVRCNGPAWRVGFVLRH